MNELSFNYNKAVSQVSKGVGFVAEEIEFVCQTAKNFPQYKYLTRPLYKVCVGKVGPIIATAISFLSADLLLHQLFPQTARCLTKYVLSPIESDFKEECEFSWNPTKTAMWMCVAVPVMYAKYKKNSTQ